MKKNWSYYLVWLLKASIFIASCYFIYLILSKNLSALNSLLFSNFLALFYCSFLLILLYSSLVLFLAFAWLNLLHFESPQSSLTIYFKSLILKYLPGNIFHFTYRHIESNKIGIGHKQLVKASLLETFGLVFSALMIINVLFIFPNHISWIIPWLPVPSWLIILLELLILISVVQIFKTPEVFKSLPFYLLYFFGMGLMTYTVGWVLEFEAQTYLFMTACFAASWLAGYIIPGAPGGVGVREVIFILLASPQIMEAEALVLIAVIRIFSVVAETLIFFLAPKISLLYRHHLAWSDKTMP